MVKKKKKSQYVGQGHLWVTKFHGGIWHGEGISSGFGIFVLPFWGTWAKLVTKKLS